MIVPLQAAFGGLAIILLMMVSKPTDWPSPNSAIAIAFMFGAIIGGQIAIYFKS